MKVTKVNINLIHQQENPNMKGIAAIVIDDSLAIHNIRIIESKEKLFIAMPSIMRKNNQYSDVVHPINQETRTVIEEAILTEYRKVKESINENN